jgi:lipid-binding SYLF domain-containing protein
VAVAALGASLTAPGRVVAVGPRADPATNDRDAAAALRSLYATTPAAKTLGSKAKGILVFPKIVKAGFMVGAQYGDGALIKNGKTAGYYNITAGSYGFQAGVQSFGYAMFFMTDDALGYLDRTGGFEVGTGPSVVLVDEGMAKSMTTTTTRSDVYSFIFGQRGLMAGVGLQGSKITKINP